MCFHFISYTYRCLVYVNDCFMYYQGEKGDKGDKGENGLPGFDGLGEKVSFL